MLTQIVRESENTKELVVGLYTNGYRWGPTLPSSRFYGFVFEKGVTVFVRHLV